VGLIIIFLFLKFDVFYGMIQFPLNLKTISKIIIFPFSFICKSNY